MNYKIFFYKKAWFNRISYGTDFFMAWGNRFLSKAIFLSKKKESRDEILSGVSLLTTKTFKSDTFIELFGENRKNQILDRAEEVTRSCFRIFGHLKIDAPQSINWHKDYVSGKEYPFNYYRNVPLKNYYESDDPKIPWELSRFHHGICLAQAYALTGQEKYTKVFITLFLDWYSKNPWKFGVNWTCAMEVAIRSCNWIAAFEIFKNSPLIKKISLGILVKNFQHHLDFILENLETSDHATTNHYISDLLGIIVISAFFPTLKGAEKALIFGFKELETEVYKQFYKDGGNWESSTTYQRFVMEILFIVILVAKKQKHKFSNEFHQRIKKSVKLLNCLADLNGQIPQFGDNDSGRILPFLQRKDTDIRHIGSLFSLLYDNFENTLSRWGFTEEAYWIFGEEGYQKHKEMNQNLTSEYISSMAFKKAGWYVMRSGNIQMNISASPNGQNDCGGHCHNDKLSFTISVCGQEIITDPGTYVYSGDHALRRKFRSTKSHSTIMVENKEQNRHIKNAIFWVEPDATVKLLKWRSDPLYDVFIAEHNGYTRCNGEVIHRRSIVFDKINIAWVIVDNVFEQEYSSSPKDVCISFNLINDIETHEISALPGFFDKLFDYLPINYSNTINQNSKFKVTTLKGDFNVQISASECLQRSIEKTLISNAYLSKNYGKSLFFSGTTTLPTQIITYLWFNKKN